MNKSRYKKKIVRYWRKRLEKPKASTVEIACALAHRRNERLQLGKLNQYYFDYILACTPSSLGIFDPPDRKPTTHSVKSFYKTKEWRILRYKALALHGRKCMCCGASPEDGIILHVDHIKPRSRFPQLELDITNLQVLCEDCNLGKMAWDDTDFRLNMRDIDERSKH